MYTINMSMRRVLVGDWRLSDDEDKDPSGQTRGSSYSALQSKQPIRKMKMKHWYSSAMQ